MLAKQLIDLVDKWQPAKFVGLEDFADKLNFLYTPIILSVLVLISSTKSYVVDSIACYSPTVFSGKNYDDYLMNYCWLHGTIPMKKDTHTPSSLEQWAELDKTDRIEYYQWVPFFLGLQIVMFYLPQMFWQMVCYNRMGTDLESVVSVANKAMHATSAAARDKEIDFSVNILASMLYQHRDYRRGALADFRRRLFRRFGILVVSKRLGTWIVVCYLLNKMLCLANAVGQMHLIRIFLGLNDTMWNFGFKMADLIVNGHTWEETLLFPRTAICHGKIRQLGAKSNSFNAICSLPINMLNEKIFMFLWFWCLLVCVATLISLPLWFMRVSLHAQQWSFVKKHLRVAGLFAAADIPLLKQFVKDYLRHDGVFILRMMSVNAGDMVSTAVLGKLWTKYRNYHRQPRETVEIDQKRADPFERMMEKLYDCETLRR